MLKKEKVTLVQNTIKLLALLKYANPASTVFKLLIAQTVIFPSISNFCYLLVYDGNNMPT